MTLSLSDLTAEKSLAPGSEDGKETLSGDDGLQVSLAVTAGGVAVAVKEKHHSLSSAKSKSLAQWKRARQRISRPSRPSFTHHRRCFATRLQEVLSTSRWPTPPPLPSSSLVTGTLRNPRRNCWYGNNPEMLSHREGQSAHFFRLSYLRAGHVCQKLRNVGRPKRLGLGFHCLGVGNRPHMRFFWPEKCSVFCSRDRLHG